MTAQRVFVYDIYNVVHDIFEKKKLTVKTDYV